MARQPDGTWKCDVLAKVAPDEPIFVLRAQDLTAPNLVRSWAFFNMDRLGPDSAKIKDAMACAEEMEKWPNRKLPD